MQALASHILIPAHPSLNILHYMDAGTSKKVALPSSATATPRHLPGHTLDVRLRPVSALVPLTLCLPKRMPACQSAPFPPKQRRLKLWLHAGVEWQTLSWHTSTGAACATRCSPTSCPLLARRDCLPFRNIQTTSLSMPQHLRLCCGAAENAASGIW